MSKDNRKIIGAVRFGGKVYRTGDEDALQAAASDGQLKRLYEKGVIEGGFAAGKSEPAAAPKESVIDPAELADNETDGTAETVSEANAAPDAKKGKKN